MKSALTAFKHYQKRWIVKDISAGLTVAAVTIPMGMGYAQIIGLPPVYGLYASVVPAIVYALLTSSRCVIFGTDAILTSMLAALLVGFIEPTPQQLPGVVALLTIIIGVFFLLFGVLRMGSITHYVSKPTMSGFISGLALAVLILYVPKMMGLSVESSNNLSVLGETIASLGQANITSLGIALLTLGLLILGRLRWPRVPAAIIVLVLFTLLSAIFNWADHGVNVVGQVSAGLPGLTWPDVDLAELNLLIAGGFVIAAVVFADTLLIARTFALRHHELFDADQELRGLGIANIVGGFFGAMPGSAAASRTAAAVAAAGRTQFTQIVAAVCIAIILMFFNSILYYVPTAVLAAIVFLAVAMLIDLRLLVESFRVRRHEFWIMLITMTAVVVAGVLPAVIISILLAAADFFLRSSKPPEALLGKIAGKDGYYDLRRHNHAQPILGVAIYRFSAPLFFANYEAFAGMLQSLAADTKTHAIIVEANAITDIDITAADGLRDTFKQLQRKNVPLYFAGLISHTAKQLSVYGLTEFLPKNHIHKTIDVCLDLISKKEH